MPTSNNLPDPALNLIDSARKDIEQYFNNLFQPKLNVPIDADGAIQSYFEQVTGDKDSAKVLTTAVIYTSLATNSSPMKVLADFKKLQPGELNFALSAFLNLNRVNTSLLGLTNQPSSSVFVQRAILA
jgi:hypothetical protein